MDPRERLERIARMQDGYGYGAGYAVAGHAPSTYAIWMGKMRQNGYTMAEAAKFWDKKTHAPKVGTKRKSQMECEKKCLKKAGKKKAAKK